MQRIRPEINKIEGKMRNKNANGAEPLSLNSRSAIGVHQVRYLIGMKVMF